MQVPVKIKYSDKVINVTYTGSILVLSRISNVIMEKIRGQRVRGPFSLSFVGSLNIVLVKITIILQNNQIPTYEE